jgi:uncharacterized membrane protein YccC
VFITAAALTIATGSHRVDVGELLLARGSDTLVGCAVGVAVFLVLSRFQESTRLRDSMADTVDAVAATIPHLAADTATLAARTARRDLQLAAIDLRDAADAAAAGSARLRASGERLAPAAVAAEHLAYRAVAACWEMDGRGSGRLMGPDDADAVALQLRGLAATLRARAFQAAEVAALDAALRS